MSEAEIIVCGVPMCDRHWEMHNKKLKNSYKKREDEDQKTTTKHI